MGGPDSKAPRVFISYSHDSEEHRDRVRELSERFRTDGVECVIDQQVESPPQGWPQWMLDQIDESDFVLVVATHTYDRRAGGKDVPGKGLGATWEGAVIKQALYERAGEKFVPIVFQQEDAKYIPVWLKSTTFYVMTRVTDYDRLYGRITRQTTGPSPVGAIRRLGAPERKRNYSRLTLAYELPIEDSEFFSVAFSPVGSLVAVGADRLVLLWDRERPAKPRTNPRELKGHTNYVYSVAFSHEDGRLLASGGQDCRVCVWDMETRKRKWHDASRHDDAVYSVAFSPDNRTVASVGYDGVVNLWDAKTGEYQLNSRQLGRLTSVAFSPREPTLLAIGSLDNTVMLWEIGSEPEVLGRHASSVEAVAFDPDGRRLASSGLDKIVRVWDVEERAEKWARSGHEYLVRSVAFSPDGSTLASASWDKSVILWDVERGRPIQSLKWDPKQRPFWHTDWIWSVDFSTDGLVATGGSDGKVVLLQAEEIAR